MNSLTLHKLLLKIELFEITKKFKEFKFEQNLRVEFTKKFTGRIYERYF